MALKSTGLLTVKKLAVNAERKEAMRLAESMRRAEEKKAKLEELAGYLKEYTGTLLTLGGQGLSVVDLRRRHAFMAQINAVMIQQQSAVEAAQHMVDECRKRWLQAKRKADGISDLIIRKEQEYERVEDKRAQRLMDDLSAQRWSRTKPTE
ncbi:MAG: flagellar export protein FliJ [Pseudomonadota bacterium]